MLRVAVCVSGGGTNLQAIIDAVASGKIVNAQIVRVVSNNRNAYALTRAEKAGIEGICVSPKDFENRDNSMEIHAWKKMGCAILTYHNWCIYQNKDIPQTIDQPYGI